MVGSGLGDYPTPLRGVYILGWLAASASDRSNPSDGAGSKVGKSLDRFRILVVEDELFVALDAQAILEANGHTIVGIAATAEEAVAVAARELPDVILMDIRLAGARDGIDAAREIRERFDIPSLFVSATTDHQTRRRAASTQPLGFLGKPFTEQKLCMALATMLRKI
jgi:two-component system, response regulator PdtaR